MWASALWWVIRHQLARVYSSWHTRIRSIGERSHKQISCYLMGWSELILIFNSSTKFEIKRDKKPVWLTRLLRSQTHNFPSIYLYHCSFLLGQRQPCSMLAHRCNPSSDSQCSLTNVPVPCHHLRGSNWRSGSHSQAKKQMHTNYYQRSLYHSVVCRISVNPSRKVLAFTRMNLYSILLKWVYNPDQSGPKSHQHTPVLTQWKL